MCSPNCLNFVERHLKPDVIVGRSVLEVGAYDFNGSARSYIKNHSPSKYLGVDVVPGKGVDELCDINDLVAKYGKESFDIVVCTEVLEHVEDYRNAIRNLKEVLKYNGKLVVTTRSPGFPIHSWPDDHWRFTEDNFHELFSDMENNIIENDPDMGVFFYGEKGENMSTLVPEVILGKPFPFDLVLGHCSFIPHTGYAAHSREFFTRLDNYITTRIRNYAHTPDLSHLSERQKNMIIEQTWNDKPYRVGLPFNRDFYHKILNIILLETNHFWFYENYDGPKVAYNVWESTRQPEHFFKKLLEFDMMWVPTNWQRDCTIEQGYPEDRIFVVPEGVNGDFYKPGNPIVEHEYLKNDKFKFLLCGRWDYRKSTTEILRAFLREFKKDEPVEIICQVENPFPVDNYKTTEERLSGYKLRDPRIKIITGLPESDDLYLTFLRSCNCLVTCARSEGWNLPLIQGLAVGIPTISSNWGAQLEFASGASHLVNISELRKPQNVFMQTNTPGLWAEPDFEHLQSVMRHIYENYKECKAEAVRKSKKIRDDFSWNNAVIKAYGIIKDFGDNMSKPEKVKIEEPVVPAIIPEGKKLNIGSGDRKLEGYINLDSHDKTADVQMDIRSLDFEDNSFIEVRASHVLEHFNKYELPDVLSNIYRILSPDGKFTIDVPDLTWVLQKWLDAPEKDKWGFRLDTIFGLQKHSGEEHKNGFTKERLLSLLSEAGFEDIKIENGWSHDQQCFLAEAYKRETEIATNDIFIIDTWPDTTEKVARTLYMIEEIKKYGYPTLVVSHYPLAPEITEAADFVIYDKNNILSEGWSLNYWFQNETVKVISKYDTKYHGASCYSSLVNGVRFAANNYDWAHFIEFDIEVEIEDYLKEVKKKRNKHKFVGFIYDEEQNKNPKSGVEFTYGIIGNLFSFDLKWMNERLVTIKSWKDYSDVVHKNAEKVGRRADYIYENWLHTYFAASSDFEKDVFLFTKDDKKNDLIIERNLFDQGKKEDTIKKVLSETDDGKVVEFIINTEASVWTYNVRDKEPDEEPHRNSTFKFVDDRIKCFAWNEFDEKGWISPKKQVVKVDAGRDIFVTTFDDSPKLEIIGSSKEKYEVKFIDNETDVVVHRSVISPSYWTKCFARYYVDWKVQVSKNDEVVYEHLLDLKNRDVLIQLDSKALGDTIAWMPYVEEFQKKHECYMHVITFWNKIFEKEYPDLTFHEPGKYRSDIFYNVGCRDNDYHSNKNNWRLIPLQKVATDYLGLPYKEIRPRITAVEKEPKKKYVTISEHSTLLCKRWHYPNAWPTVVDYIKTKGYDVMVVSKEPTHLKGIVDRTNATIQQTINNIYNSSAFIGVGSGASWLAWALGRPTVLISGFSEPYAEMQDCFRVSTPEGYCTGCYNDLKHPYDRGNWTWCPRDKKYECSRMIKPEIVMENLDKIL